MFANKNNCELPANWTCCTGIQLSKISFSMEDISKIIQKCNRNEAHGHNIKYSHVKNIRLTVYRPFFKEKLI